MPPTTHIGQLEPHNWFVVPLLQCPKDDVQLYWQTLYMDGGLDYRLYDMEDPTWSDVEDMIRRTGQYMFHVWDADRQMIMGEFSLVNFTGRAAQIHISSHPDNTFRQAVDEGRLSSDFLLNKARIVDSLFGLTPVPHRRAVIFAYKAGFKKVGILPRGAKYFGEYVDAVITLKVADEVQ